jgi:hypothetical protein
VVEHLPSTRETEAGGSLSELHSKAGKEDRRERGKVREKRGRE